MKKTIILTTLLLTGIMLTGCGNTKAEAYEVKPEVETEYEETDQDFAEALAEELNAPWTVEEFEESKDYTITQIISDYEESNIDEACRDELIELVNALEYDESYDIGYDYEALMKEFLSILKKHNFFPEEYADYTIDEIYEMIE